MKEDVLESTAATTNETSDQTTKHKGLVFKRYFTREGIWPYDTVEWEYRTAAIIGEGGEVIFEQKNVEVPKSWSMTATNIVASKYFHGTLGTPERETSVRQLINRVAVQITKWGAEGGYFASEEDAVIFRDELVYLLLNQHMAFNSPVWFNCGVEVRPQCSACFINSVEDTMTSILDLAKTEGMLFKWGSGTGSNLSPIRSSKEQLSGGGIASGPVSFMKGFDAFAGVIKSGGKTRRAAKMVILNVGHPDIVEFINSKANEEKKAWVLLDNGYGGGVDGEAYSSIFFQNANHSVRVTDEFMQAVANDGEWSTRAIVTGAVVETLKARELMRQIAESAYICGDPGMQYDTTVNRWHTSKNTAPINASNPCSEYMFLDDSACNLASLNLMKFMDKTNNDRFDIDSFRKAVDITITAQEIIVGFASYPTKKIEINSHDYRPLGLGYANLGALLMAQGIAYDSDHGRDYAAAITAMMTGEAYLQSAKIAGELSPCAGFDVNRKPFLDVIRMHRDSAKRINRNNIPAEMYDSVWSIWSDAVDLGVLHGYRNAQASVLAPTGTIGFMMDCDTTGIEPDLALVKYKKLVGGGTIKIVNNTVPPALRKLGYDDPSVKAIVDYVNEKGTIEGAPGLNPAHLPVFDCAFKPTNGTRSIHYMGHLKMMGAVQPFISGAISKTVNLPSSVTVEEIEQAYIEGWRLGLKAVAVYRDGSKRTQPLNTSASSDKKKQVVATETRPVRRHLPVERHSITHKFSVAGHEGYLTIGMYEDGTPGEIFIVMAKEGSTLSGVMDSFATTCSMALQYGVPLKVLVDKFSHTRFEPSGFTSNPQVPYAKSIMDYIFRYLASKFLPSVEAKALGVQVEEPPLTPISVQAPPPPVATTVAAAPTRKGALVDIEDRDAPVCFECGSLMVRNGACYKCLNCGSTSGCS